MSKQNKIPFGSKQRPHIVPEEQAEDTRAQTKRHVMERGDSVPQPKRGTREGKPKPK